MLVKIILIGVIVVASAALGNVNVSRASDRQKMLALLANCVKAVRNAMMYQAMPLKEALNYAGGVGLKEFFAECTRILGAHPEYTGRQICQKALEKENVELAEMGTEEAELLKNLMGELSQAVVGEEINGACSRFLKEISKLISVTAEKQLKKARLVRTMCLLSGMVIAIILI